MSLELEHGGGAEVKVGEAGSKHRVLNRRERGEQPQSARRNSGLSRPPMSENGSPNKKRPELFRVTGRPNSPPPELLTIKLRLLASGVNPTIVPPDGTTRLSEEVL